jgi:hypothetical protein
VSPLWSRPVAAAASLGLSLTITGIELAERQVESFDLGATGSCLLFGLVKPFRTVFDVLDTFLGVSNQTDPPLSLRSQFTQNSGTVLRGK